LQLLWYSLGLSLSDESILITITNYLKMRTIG